MNADVLVISAHPDDAELACSGTIKKLTNEGRTVAFVDCTLGQAGTRGNAELRKSEAQAAQIILGITDRVFLDMPDGAIMHTQENILKIVSTIRYFKPQLIVIPPPVERHPDHEAVHRLCRAATFTSGLPKVTAVYNDVEQLPHRPLRTLCYQLHYDFPRQPDFYVDISDTFEAKMQSIRAYRSQFHVPDSISDFSNSRILDSSPNTFISSADFIEGIEARARYYGTRIGVRYAEAFLSVEPISFVSLAALL